MESRRVGGYSAEAHTALLALSFAFTDHRFLDEGGSLFCVIVVFKSNDCRVSSANYLRHQEIEIDLRMRNRLCDGTSRPRLVIFLNENSRNGADLQVVMGYRYPGNKTKAAVENAFLLLVS